MKNTNEGRVVKYRGCVLTERTSGDGLFQVDGGQFVQFVRLFHSQIQF